MTTKIPGFPGDDELRLVDEVDPDSPFAAFLDDAKQAPEVYRGPERRRRHRRQDLDRRTRVRFEPDKAPRRSGLDRRQQSWRSSSTI